jgi:hypothetical protein
MGVMEPELGITLANQLMMVAAQLKYSRLLLRSEQSKRCDPL